MHESAMTGLAYFRDKYMNPAQITKILDVGSLDVNGTFRDILQVPNWLYHGADIGEGKNVDIILEDPHNWVDLKDESYDVVISGNTFEHISYPWLTIKEIARVLRKGGYLCLIAPFICPEHYFPRDCWRFLPDGMTALSDWAELEVVEVLNSNDRTAVVVDTMLIARKPL